MEPNITIFVQIINFWITYWILHRFFLKPVVAFIQQKECALAMVQDTIKRKEAAVRALQKDKLDQLIVFKTHIKTDYQMIEHVSAQREIPELEQPKPVAEKYVAIAQCKQIIIKKVCDVCSCSDL
ncbi:MAG: hypothetical protein WCT20_01140 [Candidatus Babeliales bacterium]